MKNSFYRIKGFWVSSALCLLPIVFGVLIYDKLPNNIATHFDANFEPDGYSTKIQAVFLIPFFMMLMNIFSWFMLEAEPNKKAINSKIKGVIQWIMPIMSCLVQSVVLLNAVEENIKPARFIPLLIALLIIVMGNYLPKCKQNYTVGIKLPWTLASEENWNKTHRLAGKLFIIVGFLTVIFNFNNISFYVLVIGMLIVSIITSIYSYILYRKNI